MANAERFQETTTEEKIEFKPNAEGNFDLITVTTIVQTEVFPNPEKALEKKKKEIRNGKIYLSLSLVGVAAIVGGYTMLFASEASSTGPAWKGTAAIGVGYGLITLLPTMNKIRKNFVPRDLVDRQIEKIKTPMEKDVLKGQSPGGHLLV